MCCVGRELSLLSQGQKLLEETEEKALTRLGVTYGVLRRLGFGEDRVDECLRNTYDIDLEDAFDWVYYLCSKPPYILDKEAFSYTCIARKTN